MFITCSDARSATPALKNGIDRVYAQFFRVSQHYNCRMRYENALYYGFMDLYREWHKARTLTAEEYVGRISTHCDHIPLEEPYCSRFYNAARKAVLDTGSEIVIHATIPLHLLRNPFRMHYRHKNHSPKALNRPLHDSCLSYTFSSYRTASASHPSPPVDNTTSLPGFFGKTRVVTTFSPS